MSNREYLSLMGGELWAERPASPWISVTDRLPPEFVKVLTWGPWRYQIDQIDPNGQLGYGATHWMPIPDPPKPTEAA